MENEKVCAHAHRTWGEHDLKQEEQHEELHEENTQPTAEKTVGRKVLVVIGRVLTVIVTVVLLLAATLYGVMFVLAKGPSPTARDLFVRSVQETSAIGFLARLYFSQEEIDRITGADAEAEYVEVDTSLIELPDPETTPNVEEGPVTDEWGLADEDGDGIIIEPVRGEGYNGYLMVVLDPSRVIMGTVPAAYEEYAYTVEQLVNVFDAVGGINAGGFYDPGGYGNGSIPETLVVYKGQIYYEDYGIREGFAGFDRNHILHVGRFTPDEIRARGIQYGVCFGPVLLVNGEVVNANRLLSGVNPRTAIGQRADGAVLMLVIEGRHVNSLGATLQDVVDVLLSYGAVNACNLDGGSSSMMYYNGEYLNNCSSVIGVRAVPTSFLVLKEGVD